MPPPACFPRTQAKQLLGVIVLRHRIEITMLQVNRKYEQISKIAEVAGANVLVLQLGSLSYGA
jgi:hypothetical protein